MATPKYQPSSATQLLAIAIVTVAALKIADTVTKGDSLLTKKKKGRKQVEIARRVKGGGWQLVNPNTGKPSGGMIYMTRKDAIEGYNRKYANDLKLKGGQK